MAVADVNATLTITNLISSYAILPTLASWLSTVDLYHLALTNRSHFSSILASPRVFEILSRKCLCDGRGLTQRQEFKGLYFPRLQAVMTRLNPRVVEDGEVEVRLYNTKCDEAGALPCIKCGINVCEECRYYPRAMPDRTNRRPHLDPSWQVGHIMCFCPPCDAVVEEEVTGKFLNELCDCDMYRRWICIQCKVEENEFSRAYLSEHSKFEWDWEFTSDDDEDYAPSKYTQDHQHDRAFWCMCGAVVPQDTRFRCTWCRRRHLPEDEWSLEYDAIASKMPFFQDDPNYPCWVTNNGKYPDPYPRIGYLRPGEASPRPVLNW